MWTYNISTHSTQVKGETHLHTYNLDRTKLLLGLVIYDIYSSTVITISYLYHNQMYFSFISCSLEQPYEGWSIFINLHNTWYCHLIIVLEKCYKRLGKLTINLMKPWWLNHFRIEPNRNWNSRKGNCLPHYNILKTLPQEIRDYKLCMAFFRGRILSNRGP